MSETLNSLTKQSSNDWECIVVDDGSTDDSLKIAQEFAHKDPRFRIFSRTQVLPKGANTCRNLGASYTQSSLLLFLDADDLLSPNALEERLRNLNKDSDLTVFNTAVFETTPAICQSFYPNSIVGLNKERLLNLFLNYRIPWHTSSPVWKKSFFESIGGFDVDLLRFQDVEIHIRALANPEAVITINEGSNYTSFYRKSEYHTRIDLEKRAFILGQGLIFLEKIKENLGRGHLKNSFGFLLYLLFRFEEVLDLGKLKSLRTLYFSSCQISKAPTSVLAMFFLQEKILKMPNRIRKLISYGIYRLHTTFSHP